MPIEIVSHLKKCEVRNLFIDINSFREHLRTNYHKMKSLENASIVKMAFESKMKLFIWENEDEGLLFPKIF